MRLFHSDKTGDGDDTAGQVLNDAKERALKDLDDEALEFSSIFWGDKEQSMFPGDSAQQEYEEMTGEKTDEERLDLLWRKLTGQTDLPDASNQAEQCETAKRWMNKDNFKQSIFRILSMTHGRY